MFGRTPLNIIWHIATDVIVLGARQSLARDKCANKASVLFITRSLSVYEY